jgi:hypothetical protein
VNKEHERHAQPQLYISGAPNNVHILRIAPNQRENTLNKTNWLVVNFAIVSVPDVESIVNAIHAANQRPNSNLAIRGFYNYDESLTWYGPYGEPISPLWIVMQDGRVVHSERGQRDTQSILKLLDKTSMK